MQITFDPEEESLERLIDMLEALYKVQIRVAGPDEKMRH
jgi:hypothetical protein